MPSRRNTSGSRSRDRLLSRTFHSRSLSDARSQIGKEIHLEGVGQTRSRTKRDVHITRKKLCHVRTRNIQALGKLRLVKTKPLHLTDTATQKSTNEVVGGLHVAKFNKSVMDKSSARSRRHGLQMTLWPSFTATRGSFAIGFRDSAAFVPSFQGIGEPPDGNGSSAFAGSTLQNENGTKIECASSARQHSLRSASSNARLRARAFAARLPP